MMFHLARFIGVGRVSQPACSLARRTAVSQGGHTSIPSIKDKLAPE